MNLTREQVIAINACGKYLMVSVLRHAGRDCTMGGASTKTDHFYIPHPDGPFKEVVERDHGLVLELLEPAFQGCPVRVKPRDLTDGNIMAGGNYVTSCDSRYSKLYGHPISIHDRVEAWC